ncbi:uncharacterized protein CEXT_561551 [Caerostris extrusa]|uniref:Uncharacterized protein n=1 Tax=Caerostris extrusa TaxID=172846 RepID=A0AAV4TJ27_CAEEX|nr:uncharacterized protein CEXT_561551 [Caerostris extrusa]
MPISIILWIKKADSALGLVSSLHRAYVARKCVTNNLFYLHQQNSIAAVKEFRRRMQQIRKGRGCKQILSASVENIATSVIKASSQSLLVVGNVPVVSSLLDMPYSTVQKNPMRDFEFLFKYYYKIKPVQLLQDRDSEVRNAFTLEFLARMALTSLGHEIFCGGRRPLLPQWTSYTSSYRI